MVSQTARLPVVRIGRSALGLLLLLCSCTFFAQAQKNIEVVRKIDLNSAVVRIDMTILANDLNGKYVVSFAKHLAPKLSFLQIAMGNQPLPWIRLPDAGDGLAHFEAEVPQGMTEAKLTVFGTLAGALVPVPAEIELTENQLVQYLDSHSLPSLYPTARQTTTFALGVSHIESFTKRDPYSRTGKDLVFGPITDIEGGAAASLSPITIHYQNNAPFVKALQAIREIEVSHWGNVAFEDFVEVQHAGAALKGGFSRLDFQARGAPSAVRGLVAVLPLGARSIYYRDQIGNISTSVIQHGPDGVELNLQSRFPLVGGWKNQFYQGYSVPVQELLTVGPSSGGVRRFTLTVPFSVPFPEVWVEDLTVKVVLPEWAADVRVEIPFSVDDEHQTHRLTFLDSSLSGGRPVLILKKRNVVAEHMQPMVLSYSFPKRAMLLEPLYLVLAFFSFFLVCMIFARVDLRIKPDGGKKKSKTQ